MARIVNVIHRPHLVKYIVCDTSDYRSCDVCDYKVVIETDDGRLLVVSVMDDDDLRELDIDEAIRKVTKKEQNEDWFYPVVNSVGVKDFDSFVNGGIETGMDAIESFEHVVDRLSESGHLYSGELSRRLGWLADCIKRLLEKRKADL